MVRSEPAGRSTSSPLLPAETPVPIDPPTTEAIAAYLVLLPKTLARSAPPAAPPPIIAAVFFPDLGATLLSDADIGALIPAGVATLSNMRLSDPALSRRPFLAGIASLTRP